MPPRARKTTGQAPLRAVPDLSKPAPNGNGKGDASSIEKWKKAGRPLGKNKQRALEQTVHNSGPDMPPGRYMSWLPKPEEVPPKPEEDPADVLEWPGHGHSRDGRAEWQLHTYLYPDCRERESRGEPWIIERKWEVRWVPPDNRRCQARSIGKFSEWMGNRCTVLAIKGGRVCRTHGGKLTTVRKAAQAALAQAALPAAERLIHMALKKRDIADADRLRAILAILDRAGVEGRQTVELEIKPWQEVLERAYAAETGRPITEEELEGVDFELDEEDPDEEGYDGGF